MLKGDDSYQIVWGKITNMQSRALEYNVNWVFIELDTHHTFRVKRGTEEIQYIIGVNNYGKTNFLFAVHPISFTHYAELKSVRYSGGILPHADFEDKDVIKDGYLLSVVKA